MLIIPERARAHFVKVLTEATNRGLIHKLIPQLERLNRYADESGDGTGRMNTVLGYDGADMSFSVTWVRTSGAKDAVGSAVLYGGLIFHADHIDGVRQPNSGTWSTHTLCGRSLLRSPATLTQTLP